MPTNPERYLTVGAVKRLQNFCYTQSAIDKNQKLKFTPRPVPKNQLKIPYIPTINR